MALVRLPEGSASCGRAAPDRRGEWAAASVLVGALLRRACVLARLTLAARGIAFPVAVPQVSLLRTALPPVRVEMENRILPVSPVPTPDILIAPDALSPQVPGMGGSLRLSGWEAAGAFLAQFSV